MKHVLWMEVAGSAALGLILIGSVVQVKGSYAAPLPYLNHRLRFMEKGVMSSQGQGLSISLPIQSNALPTVAVGHGFALTGSGSYWAYPPSTRSCMPMFSLMQTTIATGTTDLLPGADASQQPMNMGGGFFAYIPPVQTHGRPLAAHAKVWVQLLTETPGPVLVFTGGPWCTLRPNRQPLSSIPPLPKTINATTLHAWQQKMLALGWYLAVDRESHWQSYDHGRPVPQAGALAMISIPMHTPLVVVQASLASHPTYFTTTELEINAVTKAPVLTLTGIYGYEKSSS